MKMCTYYFRYFHSSSILTSISHFSTDYVNFHRPCHFSFQNKTMTEAGAPWQLESEKVRQRCGYLLTSGQLSDCTFVVGSETDPEATKEVLSAHKLVLAMASPVFEAMFYGRLSERNEPMIPILDVQPETFRALLQYIYTGNLNIGSFDMASELWYGADKYMLPHLVKECNSYIWSVVGPRNACQAYELAHFFDEKPLMDKCIQIISTNTKEVLNDSSFVDVELNTLITVCSLDHLNVDSELDLFRAVVKYAEAEQRRPGQISPPEDGPPDEKMSELILEASTSEEKVLRLRVESSSETSPVAELDSAEVVTSKPTADKEDLKEEREHPIRSAVEKIRFLTLSSREFAEGPACSGLLTIAESYAVMMNIASRNTPVPMPAGFSESRERRQPCSSDCMDEGPIAKPRRKPSTKFRGVAATNLPTPAEIVRGLLSDQRETLEQAARAACNLTCADVEGTSEKRTQLVAAGGIPPLVAALHHTSTGVQIDAAWALTNIACDGDHTMALVNAGAVPALVTLLGRGGVVAEQSAWALGNIAWDIDTARDAVVDAGAPSAMLAHMQPSTPLATLRTYVRSYRCICQSSVLSESRYEVLSAAVPYIENLLVLADEQVLAECCWVLYHLAFGERYDRQQFTESLIARLAALLGPAAAAPGVQTAALRTVGRMLDTKGLRDLCLGAGCMDHIVHFLKCGNPSQVECSARAAADILHIPQHVQHALDSGILDALDAALSDGNDKCQYNAALAMTNLCASGTPSQLPVLTKTAALQSYGRLLASGTDICYYVLQGLTVLLKKVDQNIQSDVLRTLRIIDGRSLLFPIAYKQHSNGQNRKTAAKLLDKYFSY